jgi:hypothetical protein
MELALVPDIYAPNIDDNGNYIDKNPPFNNIKQGISCPCGSRKDKLYTTNSMFTSHCKTKSHQTWLANLNSNKANFFIENEKMRELIYNQKMVIAKLEKDVNTKIMTIDYLTQLLSKINHSSNSNPSNSSSNPSSSNPISSINSSPSNSNYKMVDNLLDFD